jgi:hypothetical protein
MLETDVCETVNEMIKSVKKMGRCGLISDYIGFANGFAIGALMEKGVRLIGHGQGELRPGFSLFCVRCMLMLRCSSCAYVLEGDSQ